MPKINKELDVNRFAKMAERWRTVKTLLRKTNQLCFSSASLHHRHGQPRRQHLPSPEGSCPRLTQVSAVGFFQQMGLP